MVQEASKMKKYWFTEDNLLEPIDWKYFDSLPKKIKLGLELYTEGRIQYNSHNLSCED